MCESLAFDTDRRLYVACEGAPASVLVIESGPVGESAPVRMVSMANIDATQLRGAQ